MPDAPLRRAPRQARSRASERRLIEAARDLLLDRAWDEISVAEIASRAKLAVGAFYSRFASKEALFLHLEHLAFDASREYSAELARRAKQGAGALELVRMLIRNQVRLYRNFPEIARSVIGRSRGDAELRERLRELSRENFALIADALEAAGAGAGGAEGRRRLEFALYVERSVLREAVLFGEGWAKERRWSDRRLIEETVRLVARYLDLELPADPIEPEHDPEPPHTETRA